MITDLRKPYGKHIARRLSDLKDYFTDRKAVKQILSKSDPVLYEVYEYEVPKKGEHLIFATTIIHPGKIGKERYFTKGHFHYNPDAAEVIVGIEGTGLVLLQDRNKRFESHQLKPRAIIYSRPGQAHRVVNNSRKKLVFLSICRADIGHDYSAAVRIPFPPRRDGFR
ncbi:MAG: cupin domain-containing protein [Planctomycetes bacterium]|nr:cupin domain-containing protein [Planctomycetota bacterium]